MHAITCFARSVAAGTSLLLLQTLESVYARCRSQALRAIHKGTDPFASPGSGRA
jgi:hypothetical protein